jgi:predicted ATPase
MLLSTTEETSFLIETHSEHLVLRLLRRIRESENRQQPKEMAPVRPNDVSVIYLEPSDSGVQVRRLDITDDGDFEQHWPGGFFEERDEELF